jgi:hypothetical protein
MKRDVQRRLSERAGIAASARILDGDSCVIDCKTIDLSTSGARLEIPSRSHVPSEFTLCVPSWGIERRAEVVWGSGDQLGIHFLFDSPDPPEARVLSTPAAPKPVVPKPVVPKPVVPKPVVPKPVPVEPGSADLPVRRQIDDRKTLAARCRVQSSAGEPFQFGSIFGGLVFCLALVILGVFGAIMFMWAKSDHSALMASRSSTSESSGDGTGGQRGRQIGSNGGQPDDANTTFAPLGGIGSTLLLDALDHAKGTLGTTLTRDAPSSDRAGIGNRPPAAARGEQSLAPPSSVSEPPRAPDPGPAGSLGPAAFPQSAIPAFLPAPAAAERALGTADLTAGDTASILMMSRLDKAEIRSVTGCLASVIDAGAVTALISLPHFVFADACLTRRIVENQRPAELRSTRVLKVNQFPRAAVRRQNFGKPERKAANPVPKAGISELQKK